MVSKRGQGRSRLLLVSPPRAQSSLLSSLSSAHGLPARIHREKCHKNKGTLRIDSLLCCCCVLLCCCVVVLLVLLVLLLLLLLLLFFVLLFLLLF